MHQAAEQQAEAARLAAERLQQEVEELRAQLVAQQRRQQAEPEPAPAWADPRVVEEAARITAAWAAGGAAVAGAWAVAGGRLAKVFGVDPGDGRVLILYADDGAMSVLHPAALAAAGPAQVAEGEAIVADPGLPARRTAAWAAGGAPGAGAWALQGRRGRLAKVVRVAGANCKIRYADDGEEDWLQLASEFSDPAWQAAAVRVAGPAQVAGGEAMLDALGAGPSSPLGRPPLNPCAV